jgi:hypothetical protein
VEKEKPSQAGERLFKKIPIAREADKKWCFVILYPFCCSLVTVIWRSLPNILGLF